MAAAAPAVVIVPQSALESGAVDRGELQTAAEGLLQRTAKSTPADLMVCRAGCTLPFLLWQGSDGAAAGAAAAATSSDAARVARLASTYRRGYVLVPFALLDAAAVLDAVASAACSGVVTFVFMPQGASFTAHALRLARELLAAEGDATAWRQQQEQAVASAEAVTQALLGLPLAQGSEGAHQACMLQLLGSLQDISVRRADEIAAHTDLDGRTAAAVAAFFQRGARAPPAPAGLPHAGAHLQSL